MICKKGYRPSVCNAELNNNKKKYVGLGALGSWARHSFVRKRVTTPVAIPLSSILADSQLYCSFGAFQTRRI